MNPIFKLKFIFVIGIFFLDMATVLSQPCTTLGQTPSTAFPVCGSNTFHQSQVPICVNQDPMFVPGCTGADYADKNPFYYKFTCYVSGTLGFLIAPIVSNEDYDWQLFDITGHNPNDIFTDHSLVVTGNWAGSYGPTGASASGVNFIQCASVPTDNAPTFAQMPILIQGHVYLLMISHFTDGQVGYDLSFSGGSAVITDPTVPHMLSAKPDCDGTKITLLLNKRFKCTSLTAGGSEFSLSPSARTVISAISSSCTIGFDFDTLNITFSGALPNGNYDLVINNGTDGNTLLDLCGTPIAAGETVSFNYAAPQPIFADSIGRVGCAPDSLRLYFPKKIACSSIAADGSDFSITGPTSVTVATAYGNCVNGKTDYVVIKLAAPIYTQGNYLLKLKTGTDGTVLIDECGQQTPIQTMPFSTVDTVSALFQYDTKLGCQRDTLTFSHDGAHGVNSWNWEFNNDPPVTTASHTIIFPANSTNNVQLIVSNGVCMDTATAVIVFSNEVRASFTMDDIICPEDKLVVTNTSTGLIDAWRWNFDVLGTSNLKDPLPFLFPTIYSQAYYTVKLVATNNTLGCSDSARRTLTVLDFCLIAVPSAFTPNNDGLNDTFGPHNALKADNYDFKVFNRWGQVVFHTNSWRQKWDGKLNGVLQPTGVYVWMLNYVNRHTRQPVFQKGTVTLIR